MVVGTRQAGLSISETDHLLRFTLMQFLKTTITSTSRKQQIPTLYNRSDQKSIPECPKRPDQVPLPPAGLSSLRLQQRHTQEI